MAIVFLSSGIIWAWNQEVVSTVLGSDFAEFVSATSYKTDAEKFGRSDFWPDNYTQMKVPNLNWKLEANKYLPVVHVSWNDAVAYCEWKGCRLMTEAEFWKHAKEDKRTVNTGTGALIENANIKGNAWDWVTDRTGNQAKIVGGSFNCFPAPNCDGTNPENFKLQTFSTTNNVIGFTVVEKKYF